MTGFRARAAFGVLTLACALTACSSSPAGTKTKTLVRTVERTVTVSAQPSAPVSDPVAATDSALAEDPVPSVSGIVAPNRGNSPLTLEDFFEPDGNWTQSVVNVADQSGVQGIEGNVECGSSDLELRLNNAFQTLTFSVGEENTSPSSTTTLTVSVSVNGHQVTAKNIAFNKIQKFSVNVAAANAVIITFEVKDECGEVYPVVFDATVK